MLSNGLLLNARSVRILGVALLARQDGIHHRLPSALNSLWIAHEQVSSGHLRMESRLLVGLVP